MILMIDNYDSFTYNLYQLAGLYEPDIQIVRNDAISIDDIRAMRPTHIIISPGPGFPKDAGICIEAIKALHREYPILGVCLGHQAICEAFGGTIVHAERLIHGKRSQTHIANGNPLFLGLPPIMSTGRYHSLVAARETLPNDLLIIAEDDLSEVMGVKHRDFNTFGVQFHPESILSEYGGRLIKNFLEVRSQ
jgi:anthranilate synthase component 2